MIIESAVFMVMISVYDGLFKGGMLIIIYETTAELAYPIGESISLGFVLAVAGALRFTFHMILGLVLEGLGKDPAFPVFIIYMIVFFFFIILAIWLYYKSSFIMHRFIADCCLEETDDIEEAAEEGDLNLRQRVVSIQEVEGHEEEDGDS
jgi:hypothetical protein